MNPTVTVLVGMIASGKSTFSREAARRGAVVINADSIVLGVHGGDYKLYEKKLKPLYKAVELAILSSAVSLGRPVVVDGVNTSRRSRQRWVALARSFDCPVQAVVFENDGPAVHARRRSEADPRGLSFEKWAEVAVRHNSEWEDPEFSEGFEVFYCTNFLNSPSLVQELFP